MRTEEEVGRKERHERKGGIVKIGRRQKEGMNVRMKEGRNEGRRK